MIIATRAYARAGLLGNPSDGYFGKTLSVIVKNFSARITLYESPELVFEPQPSDTNTFRSMFHLRDSIRAVGYNGGIPILKATVRKFADYCDANNLKLANKNFTLRYDSSIPRQVGLAGSSALVVATLRSLMDFYQVEIPKEVLPTLALRVETEELGITAGLQDRVAQVYEGLTYMNFDKTIQEKLGRGEYEPIDPTKLPKLYLAYKTKLSKVSGKVLNTVRDQYEKGDAQVIATLATIGELAKSGRDAIVEGKNELLPELINANFDNRKLIMPITPDNQELVDTARACGASASFSGSGGAIIGTYTDDAMLNRLYYQLKRIDARVVRPITI
jgi:glucuronokinase